MANLQNLQQMQMGMQPATEPAKKKKAKGRKNLLSSQRGITSGDNQKQLVGHSIGNGLQGKGGSQVQVDPNARFG